MKKDKQISKEDMKIYYNEGFRNAIRYASEVLTPRNELLQNIIHEGLTKLIEERVKVEENWS